MIFGEGVSVPATVASADWIESACRGLWGTVGALVPNQYASILRVSAPDPLPGDWWSAYRALFEVVASIGERHTDTPHRAWFAIWEGHGFESAMADIACPDSPFDDAGESRLQKFHLPNRTYYLLGGPASAVGGLRYPDSPTEWRNPDLCWPDDRRWFVATDVDVWSLYVGGDDGFIAELSDRVPTSTELVGLDRRLEIED